MKGNERYLIKSERTFLPFNKTFEIKVSRRLEMIAGFSFQQNIRDNSF